MVRTYHGILAFVLFSIITLGGCGSTPDANNPTDMGGQDGTKIATLIEDINDAKGNARKLTTIFAKGSVPTGGESKKLTALEFTIVGKPTINGAEATAKISIRKEGTGSEVGQKDWTFVKEGESWKIKSAPLP